jgi:hypothetical protein
MRLNPRLHAVVLDGAWDGQGGELCWEGLGHFTTSEVGALARPKSRTFTLPSDVPSRSRV